MSTIDNHFPAKVVRRRVEDKNTLQNAGDIYIGTGKSTTVSYTDLEGEAQSISVYETKGQNIIDAINDNATKDKPINIPRIEITGADGTTRIILDGVSGIVTASSLQTGSGSISVGAITCSSISCTGEISGTSFNATSDKRLKENIVKYSPNKSILDLPIYSYNFISDEKKTKKIGCLAQDLKEICPEIVKEDDKGYLSIEESKIVYLLLDEIKKLKKRVDELEAR